VLALALPPLGVSIHPPPAPHDPLDVGGRAAPPHAQQSLLGLRSCDARQGPHLRVRQFPARESLGQERECSEGARHPDLLSRCSRVEAHAPAEPGGAGAEPGVPAPAGVELADQVQQARGGGLEVGRELSDLVAEAIEFRDAVRVIFGDE
jgi:hypothetical protein